jgi:hypothetical protein
MRMFERHLALERLEREMVVHLPRFAPNEAVVIGDEGVRRVVGFAAIRAGLHGVTDVGLLRLHVELMFVLGGLFDTDPLLPWAGEILADPEVPDQETRMARLHASALRYLDEVAGPRRSFARAALERVRDVRPETLSGMGPLAERRVVELLMTIDPARGAHVGEPRLRDLVRRAGAVAAGRSLVTDRGVGLATLMMFTLGHGFTEDPVLPWVKAALADGADPDARVHGLEQAFGAHVDRALHHAETRWPRGPR